MPTDLTSHLQAKDDISTTPDRIIKEAFEDVKKGDFIICNTIEELEEETISALNQKQKFYSIGPIFSPSFTNSCVPTCLWSESDCSQWLNTKPRGSVLYVSFGSYVHTSKQELEAVANGLLLSQVNFIWVLRPDIVELGETDILPLGFEDRVKGRGLIVSWCNQVDVISHQAIGGFLTHCGWNSILESIWCEVPLICYPFLSDQLTNRKLVVDDFKIGIDLCDGKLSREGVCEKINYLMEGKKSTEIREQVRNVKKILEGAMGTNGSSTKNLSCFVKDLKDKIVEKHKGKRAFV